MTTSLNPAPRISDVAIPGVDPLLLPSFSDNERERAWCAATSGRRDMETSCKRACADTEERLFCRVFNEKRGAAGRRETGYKKQHILIL